VGQTYATLSGEHMELTPVYDTALIMFVIYIIVKSK